MDELELVPADRKFPPGLELTPACRVVVRNHALRAAQRALGNLVLADYSSAALRELRLAVNVLSRESPTARQLDQAETSLRHFTVLVAVALNAAEEPRLRGLLKEALSLLCIARGAVELL